MTEREGLKVRVEASYGTFLTATLAWCSMFAWPSWTTALVFVGLLYVGFLLRMRPKPFWWYGTGGCLLAALAVFAFNRVVHLRSDRLAARPTFFLTMAGLIFVTEGWERLKSFWAS